MKKLKLVLGLGILFTGVVAFTSCKDDDVSIKQLLDVFKVNSPGLYPEGIAYDEQTQLIYLSSIRKGKIMRMDLEGNLTEFVAADKLKSVLGLTIDKSRNRLIVCNADPGFSEKTSGNNPPQLANILSYDLDTGAELEDIDLSSLTPAGSPHLTNDVVLDKQGNRYVTNSLTPAIYKITPAGEASILLMDPSLAPVGPSFGLNGIECHMDGYLIVGHYSQGALYKVPLDNPSNFKKISLEGVVNTVDGLLLMNDGKLIVVSNIFDPSTGQKSAVYELESNDNWVSANVNRTFIPEGINQFPTTVANIEGDPYVVYSFLFELAANNNPNVNEFEIRKVEF